MNFSQPVNYRKSVSDPQVREIITLFFLSGLIFGFISSIYSIYGFNVLELSPTLIGLVAGAGSLVQAIWAPIIGKLYDYVKDEYLLLFSWVFVVLASVLASLSRPLQILK